MSRFVLRAFLFIVGFGGLFCADNGVACSADKPVGGSVAESSPTAEEILTRLLRVNSVWLDPQVERLSYALTGSGPEREDAKSHFASRVWLDGKNARWEMESELPLAWQGEDVGVHPRNSLGRGNVSASAACQNA